MLCEYHRQSVEQLGPASILWVPWGTFLVHVMKPKQCSCSPFLAAFVLSVEVSGELYKGCSFTELAWEDAYPEFPSGLLSKLLCSCVLESKA